MKKKVLGQALSVKHLIAIAFTIQKKGNKNIKKRRRLPSQSEYCEYLRFQILFGDGVWLMR